MQAFDFVRIPLRGMCRRLKLGPIHRIFRQLKRKGVDPRKLDALELFGGDGENHTKDVAPVVATLEIWEIQARREHALRKGFPTATVRITDSYQELKRTSRKYGLVLVDNNRASRGHYEHFDVFPDIFRVLADPAVMILSVISTTSDTHPRD